MRESLLVLLPVLLAAGAASPDPAKLLVGRYAMDVRETIHTFEKGRWRDEPYTGARIVEIVPVASGAAYFRAALDYDNGHSSTSAASRKPRAKRSSFAIRTAP